MKIRTGFVSNSSSSSFCIFGICVSSVRELLATNEKLKGKVTLADDEDDEYSSYEIADQIAEAIDMETFCPYEGYVYIGRSWRGIKDDETGAQFKQSVIDKLKEFGITEKPTTLEEAWRDG